MQKTISVSGISTVFPVKQIKSVLFFVLLLIINLNISAQTPVITFGGNLPGCNNSTGFILGQGLHFTSYQNPLTNCSTECGVRTPGVGGNNPGHILFPSETLTAAGAAKCFSIFVFNANLNCNTNRNFACPTYVTCYIVPANFSSNSAPLPGQYLGKTIAVLNTAYGSENCISVPFTASNPNLTQQYRFLLDFAATQTCIQPGVKYVVDVLPAAPVFGIHPDLNITYTNVAVSGDVHTNDITPAGSVYNSVPVLLSSPAGSLPVIAMNSNGYYTFIADKEGSYTYDVTVTYPNELNSTRRSKLVITVLKPGWAVNMPVINGDLASTLMNVPISIKSLANDACGNYANELVPATLTITAGPAHGTATPDPVTGNVLYTPAAGYTGTDTLTYSVCDNQNPAQCGSAVQIITVKSWAANNTTAASDDYKVINYNTAGSGNVLTNDSDPQGNTQTVNTQTATVSGKGTLVLNANGSYVFTPVTGFWGAVNFAYTVCDNGTPSACASATLYINVRQAQPIIMPDFNSIKKNLLLTGDVHVNDTIPTGSLYGTSPTLISGPGGTETLVMDNTGLYTFVANTPGVYKYSVPVCMVNQLNCSASLLTITVLRSSSVNDLPDETTERSNTRKEPGNKTLSSNSTAKTTGIQAAAMVSKYTAKVGIYPNPVSTELFINLPPLKQGIVTGALYDATGRKVLNVQLRNGNNKINVSNLAKGIYTLSLRNDAGMENTQIIIQ